MFACYHGTTNNKREDIFMKKWLKYFVSGAAALTLSLGLVAGCAPDKTATASESGVVRAFALIDEEGK